MTLKSFEECYWAIIARKLNWEDADNLLATIPDGLPIPDVLKRAVEMVISEEGSQPTDEKKAEITEVIKKKMLPCLEESYNTIVMPVEIGYLDLKRMDLVDEKNFIICKLFPLKDFFEPGEIYLSDEEGRLFPNEANGLFIGYQQNKYMLLMENVHSVYEEGKSLIDKISKNIY